MSDKIVACITDTNVLLDALLHKQWMERMDDKDFSRKLSIARSLWQATRTGKRRIGLAVLKATARTYPDLSDSILTYLKDSQEA